MTARGLAQLSVYFAVLLLLVKPLGSYMARVFEGERVWLSRLLGPLERSCYRAAGVRPDAEMSWRRYAAAVLGQVAAEVYTVERHEPLARAAAARFKRMGYENIHVLNADGTKGWPEHAPYDAIAVTAGSSPW